MTESVTSSWAPLPYKSPRRGCKDHRLPLADMLLRLLCLLLMLCALSTHASVASTHTSPASVAQAASPPNGIATQEQSMAKQRDHTPLGNLFHSSTLWEPTDGTASGSVAEVDHAESAGLPPTSPRTPLLRTPQAMPAFFATTLPEPDLARMQRPPKPGLSMRLPKRNRHPAFSDASGKSRMHTGSTPLERHLV